MTDLCLNFLRVTGPAEERRRLARIWMHGGWVFQRILRQPERFTDEELAELDTTVRQSFPCKDWARVDADNARQWWRELNWGTNSDVGGKENPAFVKEQADDTMICFGTAWTPPLFVILAMSARYPSLIFDVLYCEPSCCFAGEARYFAGDGEERFYEDGDPEYRRIEREFGYFEEAETEDEQEEATT